MDENKKQEYTYFLGTVADIIHQHKQTNGEESFDFETAAQQALNLQVIGQPSNSYVLLKKEIKRKMLRFETKK